MPTERWMGKENIEHYSTMKRTGFCNRAGPGGYSAFWSKWRKTWKEACYHLCVDSKKMSKITKQWQIQKPSRGSSEGRGGREGERLTGRWRGPSFQLQNRSVIGMKCRVWGVEELCDLFVLWQMVTRRLVANVLKSMEVSNLCLV